MAETSLQKDAMDVLQRWVDQFNARAGGAIALSSGGEAGGAQLQNSTRSEEHTSELQSQSNLVCRLLLEKKKKIKIEDYKTATRGTNLWYSAIARSGSAHA